MKISQEVQQILSAAEVNGNTLQLTGQLDRTTYQAVDKVLRAIGGKWNRGAGAHVFNEDIAAMIDDIILTGEYRNVKADLQQFFTPDSLATDLVNIAGLKPGMRVFEPSCGDGRIIKAIRAENFGLGGGVHYFANEIDPKQFEKAMADFFPAGGITNRDFLSIDPAPVYDRIIMNPPFTRGQDVEHVMHAMRFLKDDGMLISVMSAGVKFRSDKRTSEFRRFVESKSGGHVRDLPEGTFRSSGTDVRTVVAVIPA